MSPANVGAGVILAQTLNRPADPLILACQRAARSAMRPRGEVHDNGRQAQDRWRGEAPAALTALVRQSRQSRHDGALHRALPQLRPHAGGIALRQADHRHRPDRLGPRALQPPPPRPRQAGARRDRRRRRDRVRVSRPPAAGDRQAADRRARPQSRLSRPGRDPDGLFHRRRGADHRLRQDDPGLHHGGGDGERSRDRAFGRPDAERMAPRGTDRVRDRRLAGALRSRRGQDRLRGVHGARHLLGAFDRPLQHHGHRLDDERARRGARHEPARLRGDPSALPRAGPDRLRHRPAHRRHGVGGPEAVRHPDARGVRERHRRQQRHRRLDQRPDPYQRHRPPHRGRPHRRRLGDDRSPRSAAGQHAAGGQVPRRGVLSRRRGSGRGA